MGMFHQFISKDSQLSESNKVADLVLKGINILVNKCSLLKSKNAEVKEVLEKETDALFKMTHHEVFRIQIQTFKLLF